MSNELLVTTGAGDASVAIDIPTGPASGLVVLTHGAGGGVDTMDLLAVRDVALKHGAVVARVMQPYRVAGRKMPPRPNAQDPIWVEVITQLRAKFPGPLVQGGRSNGARVACRTASEVGAAGVLALAFPLHPPGKAGELASRRIARRGCSRDRRERCERSVRDSRSGRYAGTARSDRRGAFVQEVACGDRRRG